MGEGERGKEGQLGFIQIFRFTYSYILHLKVPQIKEHCLCIDVNENDSCEIDQIYRPLRDFARK